MIHGSSVCPHAHTHTEGKHPHTSTHTHSQPCSLRAGISMDYPRIALDIRCISNLNLNIAQQCDRLQHTHMPTHECTNTPTLPLALRQQTDWRDNRSHSNSWHIGIWTQMNHTIDWEVCAEHTLIISTTHSAVLVGNMWALNKCNKTIVIR